MRRKFSPKWPLKICICFDFRNTGHGLYELTQISHETTQITGIFRVKLCAFGSKEELRQHLKIRVILCNLWLPVFNNMKKAISIHIQYVIFLALVQFVAKKQNAKSSKTFSILHSVVIFEQNFNFLMKKVIDILAIVLPALIILLGLIRGEIGVRGPVLRS